MRGRHLLLSTFSEMGGGDRGISRKLAGPGAWSPQHNSSNRRDLASKTRWKEKTDPTLKVVFRPPHA